MNLFYPNLASLENLSLRSWEKILEFWLNAQLPVHKMDELGLMLRIPQPNASPLYKFEFNYEPRIYALIWFHSLDMWPATEYEVCMLWYTHCLDLDLNDQTTGASSDDGFIFKKINEN